MTKLLPNTTYYVRVKSLNLSGESDYSNTVAVTTLPNNSLLENPTTISAPNIKYIQLGHDNASIILNLFSANEFVKEIKVTISNFSDFAAPIYDRLIFSLDTNSTVYIEDNYSYIKLNIPFLTPNTLYYCRLQASNKNSLSSNVDFSFRTTYDIQTPSLLGVTDLSQINAELNWTRIDNATSYDVQVATSTAFTTLVADTNVTTTTFNINTLFQDTTYYARVRSKDGTVVSPYSNIINFTTLNAVNTLADLNLNLDPIKYLNIINKNTTTIEILWATLEKADAYEVNVSTSSNFASLIGGVITTNLTSYTLTGLTANTIYYIRVRGKNTQVTNTFSPYITLNTGTLAVNSNLTPVQILSPITIFSTAIELLWITRTYATKYLIQVSDASNFTVILFSAFTTNTDTFILNYLTPATTYYIRIYGISETEISPVSNTLTVTTQISLPDITEITPSDLTNNSVTLSWLGDSIYTKYSLSVYKKYNDGTISKFLGENYFNNLDLGNNTSIHIDYFLEGGNTYRYYITGYTLAGDSYISNEFEFTTLELSGNISLSVDSEYVEWSGNINKLLISTDKTFKYLLRTYNYKDLTDSLYYTDKKYSIRNIVLPKELTSPDNYFIKGVFTVDNINKSFSNVLSTYQDYPCILPLKVTTTSVTVNIRRNYSTEYTIQFKIKSGASFVPLPAFVFPVNIGNNTVYKLDNLTANTEYQVIVRFLNKSGIYELASSPVTFFTNTYSSITSPTVNNSLTVPTLSITDIDLDRFVLNITGTYTKYLVRISLTSDTVDTYRYLEISSTLDPILKYEIVGNEDTYYYIEVVGIVSNTRTSIVTTSAKTLEFTNPDLDISVTPSISSALIVNTNEAIVTVANIPNATSYVLEISSTPTFNVLDYSVNIIDLPDNKYLLSGLLGTLTYYVRCFAYNSVSMSAYSPVITVDTVP